MAFKRFLIIGSLCIALSFFWELQAQGLEQVAVQLKWGHQFQFAGYYAAKEKGFYAEEGLDVTLRLPDRQKDYIQSVLDGDAVYGTADAGLLLRWLEGEPVVILAQIFQHSPLVLITLKESGLLSPYELVGKKVMFTAGGRKEPQLAAMFLETLGSVGMVKAAARPYDTADLVSGKVDALAAYITDQLYTLEKQGVEFNIINPQSYGIDFYGDNLFTTEKEIAEHPQRVDRMVRATRKGWRYALDHPEEIINLIRSRYNPSLTREQLAFEAKMTDRMIQPELIPLGDILPGRFQYIRDLYVRLEMADHRDITPFIYDPERTATFGVELTPGELAWLKEHPAVRISNMMNWAPLDFVEGGEPSGFSMDYARLVAEKVGLKLDFVQGYAWDELLAMGRNKELDMFATINHTPDREGFLVFTQPYLVNNPWGVFARSGSAPVRRIEDLAGRKVAVNKGFAQHEYLVKNHPEIELLAVESIAEGFNAVATYNADVYLIREMNGNYYIAQNLISGIDTIGGVLGGPVLGHAPLHMAVRKDWPELAGILEKGMDAVTMEEYNRIARKWSAPEVDARVRLTPEERQWLREHPVITLGTDATWAPFVVQRPDGTWDGLDVDFVDYINRSIGANIQIKTGKWSEMVSQAKMRKIDGLTSSSAAPERSAHFQFSDPYTLEYTLLLVRSDDGFTVNSLDDLKGKTILYQEGNAFAESVLADLEGIEAVPVVSEVAGVKMLVEGKADACMSGVTYYTDYHAKFAGMLKVGWWFEDRPLRIVFSIRKDWPELVSIINKALAAMPQEQKDALYKQWFMVTEAELLDQKPLGSGNKGIRERSYQVALTEEERAWLKEHPIITLGGGIFPPLDFVDEAGKTSGVGPGYADALGKVLGITFKYISGEWTDIFEMAKKKEIDGIRLLTRSESKGKFLNFTQPYTTIEYAIFVSKGAELLISLNELSWKNVSVIKGSYSANYIARYYPEVLQVPVASYRDALQAVINGEADAAVGMLAGITHIMGLNFTRGLNIAVTLPEMSEGLHMGVRKDWPELAVILDKGLAVLTDETRQQISQQWLNLDVAAEEHGSALTSDEIRWLAEHREIRFGTSPAWAPYDFSSAAGEHSGVVADIVSLVNKVVGHSLKPVTGLNRAQLWEDLNKGELDVLGAVVRTPEREKAYLFTSPYLELPLGVITRNDLRFVDDLAWGEGIRVAVVKGSVVHEYLERDHQELEIVECADVRGVLEAVSEGRADALVDAYAVPEYARRQLGIDNLRVTAATPYTYEVSMVVRSDWPELVSILNKKLAEISEFDKSLMLENWMTFRQEQRGDRQMVVPFVLGGGLAVGLILAAILYRNRRVGRSLET